MKRRLHALTYSFGVDRLSAWMNRRRPMVVVFHGVTREAPGSLYNHDGKHLYLPIFEHLMGFLAERFTPVPLASIVDWLEGRADVPQYAVAITFDDGYRNVLTNAAPVLRRFGMPATVYVVTDFVFENRMLWPDRLIAALGLSPRKSIALQWPGGKLELELEDTEGRITADRKIRALCKSLPDAERVQLLDRVVRDLGVEEADVASAWIDHQPLRREDLAALPEWGIEAGSHTMSHSILSRCAPDRVEAELQQSKRLIESAAGRTCEAFSYPNGGPGDFNRMTREKVMQAGYRSAVTTIKRRLGARVDRYEIPRYILTHNDITVAEFSAELSGYPTALRTAKNKLVPAVSTRGLRRTTA